MIICCKFVELLVSMHYYIISTIGHALATPIVDYNPIPSQTRVLFSSNSLEQCVQVWITSEDKPEVSESFTVLATPEQGGPISIPPPGNMALVTIIDFDGKSYWRL